MVTDSIADLLTQIRNANLIYKEVIELPHSKMMWSISQLLKQEGFLKDTQIVEDKINGRNYIKIVLKYGTGKRKVISGIKRVSKPGRRIYSSLDEMKKYRKGFGVTILSTSLGVMTDKSAYKKNVGGEVLCLVW